MGFHHLLSGRTKSVRSESRVELKLESQIMFEPSEGCRKRLDDDPEYPIVWLKRYLEASLPKLCGHWSRMINEP